MAEQAKKIGVGVIGSGVGAAHVAAYMQIPEVEVIAIAGLDDDRVKKLADQYGVKTTFRQYEELLAEPGIEAVSVAVPNYLHAPVTLDALKSGKHVLVEKPLARFPDEGRQMIAAAQERNRVLMVAFNHRYRGDVQWVRRYVETGALGRIYYAKAHWMRRSGIPRLGSWFVSKDQAGGGPLIDLGVHVLDMALYLMGEPQPLTVSASTYAEFGPRGLKGWVNPPRLFEGGYLPYEVEDLATAFVRLNGGATLLLEASWATHSAAGDDFGVTLYGSDGGVELMVRNYGQDNTVRVFSDVAGAPADMAPRPDHGEGHLAVARNFVNAIIHGGAPIPSAEEGLRCADIINACYESAAQGREVVLAELSKTGE